MKLWLPEWVLLSRDRAALLAYMAFAACAVIAVADSVTQHRRVAQLQRSLADEEAERIATLDAALAGPIGDDVRAWADPRNPGGVGRGKGATYAVLPSRPLDVLRTQAPALVAIEVSTGNGALDRPLADLTQPHIEGLGRFNLGFMLLILLPLVVLLLTYDVIARDRDTGVLRLLLAHAPRTRLRYAARAALRVLPAALIAYVAVLAAAAMAGGITARALPDLFVALGLVLLTATFWTAIALAAQAFFRSAMASGIASLGIWAALVVLAPTILAALTEAVAPIPSRIERTATSREALRRATLEVEGLLSRYLGDHPELSAGGVAENDYYVRRVAIDQAIASARAPVERAFFDAVERRRSLVQRMALLSPTSLAVMTLDEIAGSADGRLDGFRRAVDAFQKRLAEFFDTKTVRGERLAAGTLSDRPAFRFEEPQRSFTMLAVYALWTLGALLLAYRQLRRAVALEA